MVNGIFIYVIANGYTVEEAMKLFFKCYALRGIPDQGVLYVAKRLLERGWTHFLLVFFCDYKKTLCFHTTICILRLGEVTNALGYFEQAVQMNTSNVEAHLLYADALDAKTSASGFKQKDDVEKRLYLLNRVLELSPSNAKAHYEVIFHKVYTAMVLFNIYCCRFFSLVNMHLILANGKHLFRLKTLRL
jgi:tetratricopeptide (TPR) repeat protein